MPTLTLTPDPNSSPPSVFVEVAGDVGQVVSSVTLTRDGVPVLGSALAGFATATYTDYSAPYGRSCAYRAIGIESEQTWPALWSEVWTDMAAWDGVNWSAAAGIASSQVLGAALSRAAASFGKIAVADPHYVRLELLSAGGAVVGSVACTSSMVVSGTTTATIAVVDDFEAWIIGGVLYASTPAQSVSVAISAAVASVRLVSLAAGTLETSWSTTGTPYCVATDSAGNIYVGDVTNHTIRKYTSDGTPVASWVAADWSYGYGMVVDSTGNVYVTSSSSTSPPDNYIRKYTSDGTPVASWPTGKYSGALAIDAAGNIYAATHMLVTKYTSAGALVASWVAAPNPWGMAIDADGNIYVADGNVKRVCKYTPTGTFVSEFPLDYTASSLAIGADGHIYVVHISAKLVRKYTLAGALITSWTAGHQWASDLAIDAAGNIYVTDGTDKLVRKYVQHAASVGALSSNATLTTVTTDFDLAADTILDSETAWLIHPKTPALSVQIAIGSSATALAFIDKKGIGDSVQSAQSTKRRAAGASADAVFTVGPRSARSGSLRLFTLTAAGAAAVSSLLNDESPILPLFPKSWRLPLESRWYAVGDVVESSVGPRSDARRWSLPLTPAATPYVIIQPIWSWAALILEYATWADVIAAFETDYDMLTNNPRV